MRKFFVCAVLAAAGALLCAEGWDFSVELGAGLPVMQNTLQWKTSAGKEKEKGAATGFDGSIAARAVRSQSGLSFLLSYGVGSMTFKLKPNKNDSYSNFDIYSYLYSGTGDYPDFSGVLQSVLVGVGKRWFDTRRFVLTTSGILGFSWMFPDGDLRTVFYSVDYDLTMFEFSAGAEVYAAYKFNKHLSVFASVNGLLNLVSYNKMEQKLTSMFRTYDTNLTGDSKFGSFIVLPRIGVCYRF